MTFRNLFPSALLWWLFGVWVICLVILFSVLFKGSAESALCTGGTVLITYLFGLLPKAKAYSPATLMNAASLLNGAEALKRFTKPLPLPQYYALYALL